MIHFKINVKLKINGERMNINIAATMATGSTEHMFSILLVLSLKYCESYGGIIVICFISLFVVSSLSIHRAAYSK